MALMPLDGIFATADGRRRERGWQVVGVAALVLLIGDATQQALIDDDFTITTGLLAVSTLVVLDVALSWAKQRWHAIDVLVDGLPLPLVVARTLRPDQMASEGVTDDDLLMAARQAHGLVRLDEIDHAILESNGAISIVPVRRATE